MTAIQWTDETWNPVVGCSPVSEGCRNCYAAKEAIRLGGNPNEKISTMYAGTSEMRGAGSKRRAVFTGKVNLVPDRLDQPSRWRKPRRVFVNSMSDLFHESVPDLFIWQVFREMANNPQHTFQILTKRPDRMAAFLNRVQPANVLHDGSWMGAALDGDHRRPPICAICEWSKWPLSNVWLGTSVEDQAAADERILHLLQTPAAVRFLSCEPLIGPVVVPLEYFGYWTCPDCGQARDYDGHDPWVDQSRLSVRDDALCQECDYAGPMPFRQHLHWVIVGGESGPGARSCELSWIRTIKDQCQEANVPVFVKQLGARPLTDRWCPVGREPGSIPIVIKDRKGGNPAEWPEDLRVREYPREVTHA